MHVNAGQVDVIWVQAASGHDLFYLDHADLATHGRRRVEVAGSLAEHEVAGLIGFPGLHNRQIRKDTALKDVFLTVEHLNLFALGNLSADTCLCIKPGDTTAASAHALREGALRIEFQLQLARQVLTHEFRVLAHVGRHHLLDLFGLQQDANAYVRKAAAWSLGNFPDAPVLNPLIRALQTDVAAVRLWCPGSLAEAGSRSPVKADPAAGQLLVSLRIDSEAVVRSNCIWALGRLIDQLVQPRQAEIVEALVSSLLHDGEISVRDEARTALEQLEDPLVLERLQTLINDGFIL